MYFWCQNKKSKVVFLAWCDLFIFQPQRHFGLTLFPVCPSLFCLSLSLFSSSVSPELLGVLSSIAVFMALMALFFLYLSNKLSVESPDDLSHLSTTEGNEKGAHTAAWLHACTHTTLMVDGLEKFTVCDNQVLCLISWYLCGKWMEWDLCHHKPSSL